jgi:hypothetical protein
MGLEYLQIVHAMGLWGIEEEKRGKEDEYDATLLAGLFGGQEEGDGAG